jgi:hypothetical protein
LVDDQATDRGHATSSSPTASARWYSRAVQPRPARWARSTSAALIAIAAGNAAIDPSTSTSPKAVGPPSGWLVTARNSPANGCHSSQAITTKTSNGNARSAGARGHGSAGRVVMGR